MGERIRRIRRIQTDFFYFNAWILSKKLQKIRFNLPNPPHPFSHCIPKPLSVVYIMGKRIRRIGTDFSWSLCLKTNLPNPPHPFSY
jgi:hypothetical protein